MKRAQRLHVWLLAILILSLGSEARAQSPVPGLDSLFAEGYILQDRNGDGIIDFVAARIVLPDRPTQADAVAAANVAARLGFETSAMNLDLATRASALPDVVNVPVILIGSADGYGIDQHLSPGQGLVEVVPPGDRYRQGGVRLVGADGTGLLAAADYLSGRYPNAWDPKGATLADATARFGAFLKARDVAAAPTLRQVVVDRLRPGLAGLTMTVRTREAAASVADRLKADPAEADSAGVTPHLEDVHALIVDVVGAGGSRSVRLLPEQSWETADVDVKKTPLDRSFSLYELYSLDGLFKDTNDDFVPDDMGGYISYAGNEAPEALVELAARIGLETAGVRLPLVRPAGQDARPEDRGLPLFMGREHPHILGLAGDTTQPELSAAPGEGYAVFLKDAMSDKPAIVLGGADPEGLASATSYVAGRVPYLWDHGKGRFELSETQNDVRRFFQGVDGAGQAAAGLQKLDTWLTRLSDHELQAVDVELTVEEAPASLAAFVEDLVAARAPGAAVTAQTFETRYGVGKEVFDDSLDIPWEVDAVRNIVEEGLLPRVGDASSGRLTVRVSESPEVRAALEEELAAQLTERGAPDVEVSVLSAYKQGFSWLVDEVMPVLQDEPVARIEVTYHNLEESEEVRWQTINADTRWLQELYPVDAVLARDLGLPDSAITFHPTRETDPTYTLRAYAEDGSVVHTDTFDPTYVVRPYFDHFPRHDSVRVTTGWVHAEIDGKTVVDRRVRTDLETFWDYFQDQTVGQIIEYVMDTQDGAPENGRGPYFDALKVDVTLSEPNYRLGINQHVISSTEALHEDVLFQMFTLFNLIGQRYGVGGLDHPGRILPYIRPPVDGEPGHARVTLTGKDRAINALEMTYTEQGEEPVTKRYELPNLGGVADPVLRGVWTRAGHPGVSRLLFEVEAEVDRDAYETYRTRAAEARIDRVYPSVERLSGMVDMLERLHEAGLYQQSLSYDRVDEIRFQFAVSDSTGYVAQATVPQTAQPLSTNTPVLYDEDFDRAADAPMVQWEMPIPPGEANDIIARLSTFPVVESYYMATSALGRDIFALDLLPPHEADYVSQAKLIAQKPTLYLNAREHANEVSSTSYSLRLAEMVATDLDYRQYLDRVNLVIHPMNNPDGAQIAYEMFQENPNFMLHVGYQPAFGPSLSGSARSKDPIYPEAKVKPALQRAWLPDVYINLHGYPSHEWVQYFSGYSAWVFSRSGQRRDWWPTRGYFLTGYDWIEDTEYPELKEMSLHLLDSLTAAVASVEDFHALSQAEYRRYRKYRSHEPDFGEYIHNGVRVHGDIKGDKVEGKDYTNPRVINFSITTETPDETAYGDYLDMNARTGIEVTTAALRYLYHGENKVKREADTDGDTVVRKVYRIKPVLPVDEQETAEPPDAGAN